MRNEVNLKQGSPEWLDFRTRHRMASETAPIMGVCPYQTASHIRKVKLGKVGHNYINDAMQQGINQEPIARAAYGEMYEPIRPAVFVYGDYGASLDGITLLQDAIVEIKTPYGNAKKSARWMMAQRGELTPTDNIQIQHQMMVTQCQQAYLWVWDAEAQEGIRVSVSPDPILWDEIMQAWDAFWPTLCDREDREWHDAAQAYINAKRDAEDAVKKLKDAQEIIEKMTVGNYSSGHGLEVRRITRKGTIDWQAVQDEHLPAVDVEPYRKTSSSHFKITINP